MKVIDLKDRTIFVDDIIQLYIEENYTPERYQLETKNGTYRIYKDDYFIIKEYLLSLNDKVENYTTKIQELEKEKAHIEIAYEEDYREQQQEIERLNNIIKEVREYIMTNGIHSDYGDKGIDDENKLLAILDKENQN